jgi:hypothetical protein
MALLDAELAGLLLPLEAEAEAAAAVSWPGAHRGSGEGEEGGGAVAGGGREELVVVGGLGERLLGRGW